MSKPCACPPNLSTTLAAEGSLRVLLRNFSAFAAVHDWEIIRLGRYAAGGEPPENRRVAIVAPALLSYARLCAA